MKTLFITIAAAFSIGNLSACADQSHAEPSQAEMKQALLNAVEGRGLNRIGSDTVSVDNPLNGVAVSIDAFEKNRCEPAADGHGHFCDYVITTTISVHSNSGTSGGSQHAQGANALLSAFLPDKTSTSSNTRRFARINGEWFASER